MCSAHASAHVSSLKVYLGQSNGATREQVANLQLPDLRS
jgi:hypothetical protein